MAERDLWMHMSQKETECPTTWSSILQQVKPRVSYPQQHSTPLVQPQAPRGNSTRNTTNLIKATPCMHLLPLSTSSQRATNLCRLENIFYITVLAVCVMQQFASIHPSIYLFSFAVGKASHDSTICLKFWSAKPNIKVSSFILRT